MEIFVNIVLLQTCVALEMATTSFKSAMLLHLTDGEMDLTQCQSLLQHYRCPVLGAK